MTGVQTCALPISVYVNDFGDREDVREGEFYRCEITEAHDYDLVARIVE